MLSNEWDGVAYVRTVFTSFFYRSEASTLFKITLTGTILTVLLFSPDPDPAFQAIPDPNPSVKLGQISTVNGLIVSVLFIKRTAERLIRHFSIF